MNLALVVPAIIEAARPFVIAGPVILLAIAAFAQIVTVRH